MKWHEVREMYPNQFVKFEIVEYHEDEKSKYVDEVALIKVIKDGREAMKEFTKCKNGQLVYSTENESIVIEKIKHIGIRRGIGKQNRLLLGSLNEDFVISKIYNAVKIIDDSNNNRF